MERKVVATKKAPAAIGPYAQANIIGNLVFTSGQVPLDPETGLLVEGGIEAQTRQSLNNIKAVLEAAGSTMDQIIKTTCFLANMEDFTTFNGIYEKYFTGKPARSCVAVKQLPKNVLCEVEVIAVVD